jgi:hypothetical protein
MRTFVPLTLVAALASCTAYHASGQGAPGLLPPSFSRWPAVRAQRGVSARYVVETGRNADGMLQLDVRPVQESSLFSRPSPFRSASIEYPDRSTQAVDARGEFDAAASTYAQKHGEPIGGKLVTIHVLTPIDIALQPSTFQIYVPSEATQAQEESYFASVRYKTAFFNGSKACRSSWPHQDVAPDDTAEFVFTIPISAATHVYQAALYSCDKQFADGKILGYEWIALPGTKEIRLTYRYQAPSRAALAAAGVTRAREYIDLHGYKLPPQTSQRFDVSCVASGC